MIPPKRQDPSQILNRDDYSGTAFADELRLFQSFIRQNGLKHVSAPNATGASPWNVSFPATIDDSRTGSRSFLSGQRIKSFYGAEPT